MQVEMEKPAMAVGDGGDGGEGGEGGERDIFFSNFILLAPASLDQLGYR